MERELVGERKPFHAIPAMVRIISDLAEDIGSGHIHYVREAVYGVGSSALRDPIMQVRALTLTEKGKLEHDRIRSASARGRIGRFFGQQGTNILTSALTAVVTVLVTFAAQRCLTEPP
jgi:hypothetical protein